ncbi:hypothetical protein SBV1_1000010 [Verrucomicrobia bacterium]|nr:hypothetical protein SBV1_1000010 [Verrucomicrobiota bacterium]
MEVTTVLPFLTVWLSAQLEKDSRLRREPNGEKERGFFWVLTQGSAPPPSTTLGWFAQSFQDCWRSTDGSSE